MCPGQCDCSMMEIHDLKELRLQKLNRAAKMSSLFTRESGHYCIIIAEGHALFCFDKYLNFFFFLYDFRRLHFSNTKWTIICICIRWPTLLSSILPFSPPTPEKPKEREKINWSKPSYFWMNHIEEKNLLHRKDFESLQSSLPPAMDQQRVHPSSWCAFFFNFKVVTSKQFYRTYQVVRMDESA